MTKNDFDRIINSKDLYQVKNSEVKDLREMILEKQNFKDAITHESISKDEKTSLDHQHKNRKSDENGINGDGLIRGVLKNNVNLCEGKIWNATKRFLGAKTPQDRINFLELLIKYYKKTPYNLIHPSEKKPEKRVMKSQYNKLRKLVISEGKKIPDYPKSGILTKSLKVLFDKYQINPFVNDAQQ